MSMKSLRNKSKLWRLSASTQTSLLYLRHLLGFFPFKLLFKSLLIELPTRKKKKLKPEQNSFVLEKQSKNEKKTVRFLLGKIRGIVSSYVPLFGDSVSEVPVTYTDLPYITPHASSKNFTQKREKALVLIRRIFSGLISRFIGMLTLGRRSFSSSSSPAYIFRETVASSAPSSPALSLGSCVACCYVGAEGSIVGGLIFGDFVDRSGATVFPVTLDEISGLSSMKLSVGKSLVMKTGTVVFAPACSSETSGRSLSSPANLDVWGTNVLAPYDLTKKRRHLSFMMPSRTQLSHTGDILSRHKFEPYRGYIAEHPNDEEEVEGIDLHQQCYLWEGSDMDYLYDEQSSFAQLLSMELTLEIDGAIFHVPNANASSNTQAWNICVAAFDSTCSGICRSPDPIVEVNMQCVDLEIFIWKLHFEAFSQHINRP
ncbi:hypothetical protein YC2023_120838 [Brassica napus]